MLAILCLSIGYQVSAQDIHWSQFANAPLFLNPALTGIFKGDQRFMANYRSQWNTVPVSYLTFSGAYDMNFYDKKLERSRFGAGLLLGYDRAGDSRFSKTNVGVSGSYTHQVAARNFVTLGVQGGIGQRSFSLQELTFDNQFNGEAYEKDRATGENFLNTNRIFPDLSAGLNWHYRSSKRTMLDIGGAMYHINEPQKSFYEDKDEKLASRYTLYGIGTFMLADAFDLFLHASGQFQTPHSQIALGAGGNIHLNTRPDRELAISLGAFYRFRDEVDAIIPYFGLRYRMWRFGLSYDINLSEFQVATDGFGGPEVSLSYIITKVKPLKAKICPIFL